MICDICGENKRQAKMCISLIKRKKVCLDCYKSGLQKLLSEYSRKVTRRNVANGTATLPELKHDFLVNPIRRLI